MSVAICLGHVCVPDDVSIGCLAIVLIVFVWDELCLCDPCLNWNSWVFLISKANMSCLLLVTSMKKNFYLNVTNIKFSSSWLLICCVFMIRSDYDYVLAFCQRAFAMMSRQVPSMATPPSPLGGRAAERVNSVRSTKQTGKSCEMTPLNRLKVRDFRG